MPGTSVPVFEGFPHVLRSQQFDREHLEFLFDRARKIRMSPNMWHGYLHGQSVAVLFSEPSSRTFTSFQLAARLLGAQEVQANQNMGTFSSEVKGESLADTLAMFIAYGFRYFILRRKEEGSVEAVAEAIGTDFPVINAGDGAGQHPTQALLDAYTIWEAFSGLDERPLHIGLLGDLLYGRTVHSLVYLLAKFPNIRFTFLSPEEVRMKEGITEHLREHGTPFTEHTEGDVLHHVRDLDVLYVTRPQLERTRDATEREMLSARYRQWVVTPEVADALPAHAIIMHPLPRNEELPTSIDANPRARWRAQMANGLWVRAALLSWIQEVRQINA